MKRFQWIQRGNHPPHYELQCNGTPYGSLSWVQGSRSTAVAEIAGGVMVFRREGILRRRIVIETLREELVARISHLSLATSGELRHADGSHFRYTTKGGVEWSDAEGKVVARIDQMAGEEGGSVLMEMTPAEGPFPLVLIFAGWYLYVTRRHDVETPPVTVEAGLSSLETGLSLTGSGSTSAH